MGGDSIKSIHVWVGHFRNLRRVLNVFIFMNIHVISSTKAIVNRLDPRKWRRCHIDTSGCSSGIWSSLHIAGFALLSLVLQVHEDYQTQKHKAKGAGRNDEELAHFINCWYWDTWNEKRSSVILMKLFLRKKKRNQLLKEKKNKCFSN